MQVFKITRKMGPIASLSRTILTLRVFQLLNFTLVDVVAFLYVVSFLLRRCFD